MPDENALKERIAKFLKHFALLDGDEKGEAQVFLDRFFQALGHEGAKEAGAVLEDRVRGEDVDTKIVGCKPELIPGFHRKLVPVQHHKGIPCTVSKCKNGNIGRNHRIILRHKCMQCIFFYLNVFPAD